MFSQYMEIRYASELLADGAVGAGCQLKVGAADVSDFIEVLRRVASEGTAHGPEFVAQRLSPARDPTSPISNLRNPAMVQIRRRHDRDMSPSHCSDNNVGNREQ